MIGVQHHEQGKAEIRRLRVREDLFRRNEIGTRLLETALRFCKEQHYLKVTLDTFIERESAIKLFEKFHFRLDRAKSFSGKDLLYFYLDLYGSEKQRKP
jgi:ribosomal protein S18 acetylase RimI-like enzyme